MPLLFTPASSLFLAKDAGLMMNAAKEAGTSLAIIPAIAAIMDEWMGKGHGNDDWSVIAKDGI